HRSSRAADGCVRSQPASLRGAAKRHRQETWQLGRDPRGADCRRRHLRNEFQIHAGAGMVLRLPFRVIADAGDLRNPLLLLPEGRLALILGGMTSPGSGKLFCGVCPARIGLLVCLILATMVTLFPTGTATAGQTLQVEAPDGLPGFPRADLQRLLA